MARSTHNQDGISGYSTRFCISHPTGHILLIISPGNQIKANNNGAAKSKFSNMCEINCRLGFDARPQDVGEKPKETWPQ